MRAPSGDQRGAWSFHGPVVNARRWLPSEETSQRLDQAAPFSRSFHRSTYTTQPPLAEICGSTAERQVHRSAGVKGWRANAAQTVNRIKLLLVNSCQSLTVPLCSQLTKVTVALLTKSMGVNPEIVRIFLCIFAVIIYE